MIQDIKNPDSPHSADSSTRSLWGWRHRCTWKHGVMAVCLGGLAMGSTMTNPSRATYETYATEQASGFLLQEICRKNLHMPQILQQALLQGCESLAHGGKSELRTFIHQNTEHYNFGVLSLYTTELPGHQLRTLGLWGNFFILSLG